MLKWFKKRKIFDQQDIIHELHELHERLDHLLYTQSTLPTIPEPYRTQMIDFATKAEFAVGSLFSTVKLASEEMRGRERIAQMRVKQEADRKLMQQAMKIEDKPRKLKISREN